MCTTCGCSDHASPTMTDPDTGEARPLHEGPHHHPHPHVHEARHTHAAGMAGHPSGHHDHHHHHHSEPHHDHHPAGPAQGAAIPLEAGVLEKNNRIAERNRGWFAGRRVLALNLVSSPGAGKTTLLERTLRELASEIEFCVVEGDQATANDAERIRATGARVVQINTGAGCHLEADMVARALEALEPPGGSVLMIENVGNLVCPALFDLGEHAKIAILSVTEGEDKPIKYPHMFRAASVLILNKIDLLPHVAFDVERCIGHAREVNPDIEVLRLSASTGEGLDAWYGWLRARLREGAWKAAR